MHPFPEIGLQRSKDTYFHILILPRHRPFLSFAFKGQAYQYKVLPFGMSLSFCIFTKVVEVALVPIREHGIYILNYLDGWLKPTQSRDQLCKTGMGALSPQPVGTLSQLGKEQTNSPLCR